MHISLMFVLCLLCSWLFRLRRRGGGRVEYGRDHFCPSGREDPIPKCSEDFSLIQFTCILSHHSTFCLLFELNILGVRMSERMDFTTHINSVTNSVTVQYSEGSLFRHCD